MVPLWEEIVLNMKRIIKKYKESLFMQLLKPCCLLVLAFCSISSFGQANVNYENKQELKGNDDAEKENITTNDNPTINSQKEFKYSIMQPVQHGNRDNERINVYDNETKQNNVEGKEENQKEKEEVPK